MLNRPAKNNILSWKRALEIFHGYTLFCTEIPLPSFVFATDPFMRGRGAHLYHDWYYIDWAVDLPDIAEAHINVLELETV